MLQCPSKLDFDMTLQTNAIRGCQVTLEDAQVMWKIWGPSVIKMKGNSTQEENDSKIIKYCGGATRVHHCTEERHSEC